MCKDVVRTEGFKLLLLLVFIRGDKFCRAFSWLGELQSIIPDNINIIALTATTTKETFSCVKARLSLYKPAIIAVSPEQSNVKLSVVEKLNIDNFVEQVSEQLKEKRLSYPKTIILCHSYGDVSQLYGDIFRLLGANATEPPGYPNVLKYRLLTMYSRASTSDMKKMISTFCTKESVLRVVITTTAFSIGLDCPDTYQIIYWGPSSDFEQYVQEIG